MKIKRLSALCLSVLLLTGCTKEDLPFLISSSEPESSAADHSAQRYNTDRLKEMAQQLQETKKLSGAEQQIQTEIQAILDEVDKAYAVFVHANMEYYADWNNRELAALSDETHADYSAADEIATWAFCNACKDSDYDELFEPYVQQEWLAYYVANSLNRVISRARENAAQNDSILDDYYNTAYDENIDLDDPSETNYSCAKLYLETLQTYQTDAYLYDYYSRDYTAEQASSVYHELTGLLVPVYEKLRDYVLADPRYGKLREYGFAVDDPFQTLKQYAPSLSPSIAESVDKLFSGPYYLSSKSLEAYDGSFTASLPSEQTAYMYIHLSDDYYDLTTVVHEFGHFNSDWRDLTPVYLSRNCIDIAEVQSQGMEMLFTSFYDDIYGADADYLEALMLYNTIDSVLAGFAVGEFENQVMRQQDSLTPKEICNLFDEMMDSCGLTCELYQISHLYEQPGYYVSYGVSALAALDLYANMQNSMEHALSMYTQIMQIPTNAGETMFCQAMKSCGFGDVFEKSELERITAAVSSRVESLRNH